MIFVYIIGGLVLLFALINIIGLMLPEKYEGAMTAQFDATSQDVWDALSDYRRHPMTAGMMKSIEESEGDSQSQPQWIEAMGDSDRITITMTESQEPSHMVREMQSASVPMTSRWVYELAANDDGCRVTVAAVTTIRRGTWHVPIFRLMMKLTNGVRAGIKAHLNQVFKTMGQKPQYE